MHLDLALVGFGNVGRELARLLLRKREILDQHFPDHIPDEIDLQIREMFDIHLPREAFGRSG